MVKLKRKVSTGKYLAAAIITIAIFLIGVFLGYVLDEQRVNYLEKSLNDESMDVLSLQMQEKFINDFKEEKNCGAMKTVMNSVLVGLEKTRGRLEDYKKDSSRNQLDYEDLKRKYMLEEIRFWMLAKDAKETCNFNFVQVLYVYGNENNCKKCYEQGIALTYLKKQLGENLLIFSTP